MTGNKAISALKETGGGTLENLASNADANWSRENVQCDAPTSGILGHLLICTKCSNGSTITPSLSTSYPVVVHCPKCGPTVHNEIVITTTPNSHRTTDRSVYVWLPKLYCSTVSPIGHKSNGIREYTGITPESALCDEDMLKKIEELAEKKKLIDAQLASISAAVPLKPETNALGAMFSTTENRSGVKEFIATHLKSAKNIQCGNREISSIMSLLDDGKYHSSRTYRVLQGSSQFADIIKDQQCSARRFETSKLMNLEMLHGPGIRSIDFIGAGSFGKVLKVQIGSSFYALKYGLAQTVTVESCNTNYRFIAQANKFMLESEFCKANVAKSMCGNNSSNIVPHYAFFFIYLGNIGIRNSPVVLPVLLMKLMGPTINDGIMDLETYPKTKSGRMDIIYYLIASIGTSLTNMHNSGLIHGDMKTDNIIGSLGNTIMQSSREKLLSISDFSLSSFGNTDFKLMCDAFRPPEVWIKCKPTTAIDIWGLGCIFIDIFCVRGLPTEAFTISESITLPAPKSETEYLMRIIEVFGPLPEAFHTATYKALMKSQPAFKTVRKYELKTVLGITGPVDHRTATFLDLLDKMMKPDPTKRITIDEICRHQFMLMGPPITKE
jgi:serine/threonine protein kinase